MYMISLIVVLSALFVALEYNSGDNEDDVEDYDELTEEMELAPLKREEDRIALAIKQQPKPAADKIKVVEKIKELNRMDMPEEKKDEAEGKDSENDGEKQEKEKENPLFATADNALDNNPLNFRIVEDLPQFPGGGGYDEMVDCQPEIPSIGTKTENSGKGDGAVYCGCRRHHDRLENCETLGEKPRQRGAEGDENNAKMETWSAERKALQNHGLHTNSV